MLADLLHPERVRTGLTLSDKDAALRMVSSLLCAPEGAANEEVVYEVLLERERLASTGIGSGVAIPHGRYDGVDELRAAVAVCPCRRRFRRRRPRADDDTGRHRRSEVDAAEAPGSACRACLVCSATRQKREALLKAADDAGAYRTLVAP